MRIVLLTPGTGTFYCGSCLRDSVLAHALTGRGHDVRVVPLYLPPVLERDGAEFESEVQMGGVTLYLHRLSPLFRRMPRALERALDSPALLRLCSRFSSMTQAGRLGPITVDTLRGDTGPLRLDVERLAEHLLAGPRPDVVLLSNIMLIGAAHKLREALGAPVVCTLQGEAPFLDALDPPHRERAWTAIRERLRHLDGLYAVSRYYRDLMASRLGLDDDQIDVAWNGIDIEDIEPGPEPPSRPTIGYLARLCRDKGLDTLLSAFLSVARAIPDVRLRLCGVELREDRPFVDEALRIVRAAGLSDRVEVLRNVGRAEKVRWLRSISVLSVPARYAESFGLYVLEAWAAGVPVVEPRHAAFAELIEDTKAGVLCDPDDPQALAAALTDLLLDEGRRRELGRRGRQAVLDRFTAEHMAMRVEAILARATDRGFAAGGYPPHETAGTGP